jgi:alpha-tubulin suppressor-like RCC1 family protein
MHGRGLALLALGFALLACGEHARYACESSTQCVLAGAQGTCEPEGFCAFPDSTCPSGERFESGAGNGLAGQCTGMTMPDGALPACGAIGGACCATGAACLDNLYCSSGTCSQCVTDVALGVRHDCYLKHDGTVWCSGQNQHGQLGNGGTSTIPIAMPTKVIDSTGLPIEDATALGTGQSTTCAIRAGGAPWCWGASTNCNDGGQVGDGGTNDRDHAVQVVRNDTMPFTGVAEISGDYCRMCARDTAGGVWCWGDKDSGDLGDGGAASHSAAVSVMANATTPFTAATSLSCDGGHACVLDNQNQLWCWGHNDNGQIGNGSTTAAPFPVMVTTAVAVAGGRNHTCAQTSAGGMLCWGQGSQGRLGNGTGDRDADHALDVTTPHPVLADTMGGLFGPVTAIAAGAETCALMPDTTVECWGVDLYGQTGTGAGTYLPAPVLRSDGKKLSGVERIVAGFTRVCAFLATGELLCWGRNSEGELGNGTFTNVGYATPSGLTCP